MPPIEASKDMPVQSSNDTPEKAPSSSPNSPLNEMSIHSGATAGTAAPPEAPFRLMDLPAELRNNIYRQHFSELSALKPKTGAFWDKTGAAFLSILQASHQVRREAAPIFYQEYIGNAGDEDEKPWIFESYSVLDMLKTLLAISKQLKEHGPDTRVSINCSLSGKRSDMWKLAKAVYELSGVEDGQGIFSRSERFTVGYYNQFYADGKTFLLEGPIGQVDWSGLSGLYDPSMEGRGYS